VDILKAKIVKLENENREYSIVNEKLEKKVSVTNIIPIGVRLGIKSH
jgi:hypothetical protein